MKWIPGFWGRARVNREFAQEAEAHLEEKIADLMDSGIPEKEAREQARREFGNVTLYREASRDVWGWIWLETLVQDIRYGARMVRTNPGFTAVATTTLALGIALNSTIFSVISGWLLKKPTIADPDRVVAVVSTNKTRALERGFVSGADFMAWRTASHSYSDLAAVEPYHAFSLTGGGEPERLEGMQVTANYFRALGVSAYMGRTFAEGEDQAGHDHVVVLSHGLWARRFASDPGIIGQRVALDGEKYVVIGVLPAAFRQTARLLTRLWTPLVLPAQNPGPKARDQRSFLLVGRLKSGVALAQARAEMAGLAERSERSDPASEKGWGANVMTLQEYAIEEDQTRVALNLLITAVGLVLVIACANIANLLLARGARRQQEIAIRTAIGAGRMRVIRQLLVESLMIALMGGCAGLAASYWGIRILRGALGFNEYMLNMSANISLDQRVLAFTLLVSIGTALLFGLMPAIRLSGADPQSTLRERGRSGDLRRSQGRNVLVGSQIALAMVLVIGAGLIIKATSEDLGGEFSFNPRQILVAAISLTDARYHDPERQKAFFQSTADKLRPMPGVEAIAIASAVPFNAEKRSFRIQGQPAVPAGEQPKARYFAVSPGYFDVLHIALVQGRAFRESDNAANQHVAIVNRAFAERFFAGQDPLGHYIRMDHDAPAWSEIVGMVDNVKVFYGRKEEDPQVYESFLQVPPDPEMWILARAGKDASLLAPALRNAVWSVDRNQPIGSVETIARLVDQQQGGDYVFDTLLGIFGVMALVLASVGIYGVISYGVAQRTHEIGIRMALGAHRANVLRSVVGRGMLLAVVSAGLGLAAATPLPRLFTAILPGYRVHGSPIFGGVGLLVMVVVCVAVYIPARRAAGVDPAVALRHE